VTGGGCPKYGDYNGIACGGNYVVAAWTSATAPSGVPAAAGLRVYASAEYVGPTYKTICELDPRACVGPIGFGKDLIRVKCEVLPCVVLDPIPRNCLLKWNCPGCLPGSLCPPFYHFVFDDTIRPWDVDVFDAKGRQVPHTVQRIGRNTILTVRPDKADLREGEIADYQLAFKAGRGIKPGVKYAIRARLLTSDKAALDPALLGRR